MDGIVTKDSSWPLRVAAMNVYYSQIEYKKRNGFFASTMEELSGLTDRAIVSPLHIEILRDDDDRYTVFVRGAPDGAVASITHNRFLQIVKSNSRES